MPPDTAVVTKRNDIDRLIAFLAPLMPWRLPLLRAARDGVIALAELDRKAGLAPRSLRHNRKPYVVLMGDDDGASTGPAGWASALRFAAWARAGLVHATGGQEFHYQAAVDQALRCGRLLLIETVPAHASAWITLFDQRTPVLLICPPPGGSHPNPGIFQ